MAFPVVTAFTGSTAFPDAPAKASGSSASISVPSKYLSYSRRNVAPASGVVVMKLPSYSSVVALPFSYPKIYTTYSVLLSSPVIVPLSSPPPANPAFQIVVSRKQFFLYGFHVVHVVRPLGIFVNEHYVRVVVGGNYLVIYSAFSGF